jgi:hypothetical protein
MLWDMDWEKTVTITAGVLYIILEGPRLAVLAWGWIMKIRQKPFIFNFERKYLWFHRLLKLRRFLIIVFAVAGLFWLFRIERKKNEPVSPQVSGQNITSKPSPDKIIPQPVISNTPSIVSTTQVANSESQIQFETSNPSADGGDSESELANIKTKKLAEIAAQKEADRKQNQSDSDNRWKEMLPIFKDCIETFYNILKKEADHRNEGIAKTVTYFDCLPPTINYELGGTNIAEIKFKNQTNIDFHIAITSDNQFRGLRISGSCGYFEIHHANIYAWYKCNIIIRIQGQGVDEDKTVSLDQTHDLIEEDLKLLKDGQIAYLSNTNKLR